MQVQKEETIDLRSILHLLRKRLGLIILSTFIVAVIGTVYTFFIATPTFTATTQLVAKLPDSSNSAMYAGQITGNIQMANTINQVIVSHAVLDKVQANLNLPNSSFQSKVTATNTTNSQVITVTATYGNPYTAQKIANETAKVFSDDIAQKLNVTNVIVLTEATANTTPVSPRPKLYISLSALVGLIIGCGLTFLLEIFNNKINTEADIEALGLPILGATSFANSDDFSNPVSADSLVKETPKVKVASKDETTPNNFPRRRR
ncbi:MAG: YveK family protein [Lactococcus sp.]